MKIAADRAAARDIVRLIIEVFLSSASSYPAGIIHNIIVNEMSHKTRRGE
jgi:hypothetical protein